MADIYYPITLPTPQLSEYQLDIDYNIEAVVFESGNRRQRRVAKQERMVFSLTFVISYDKLWAWQYWVNRNAYIWHFLEVESNYTRSGEDSVKYHYIRYISDISIEAIDQRYFKASVQAEMDLNRLPPGTTIYSGNWVLAGVPSSPSTDRIIGGTPGNPTINNIIAGTPDAPAA